MSAIKWIILFLMVIILFLLLNSKREIIDFLSQTKLFVKEISIVIEENEVLKKDALKSQVIIKSELNNAEYQNKVLKEALEFKQKYEEESNFILRYASSSPVPYDGKIVTSLSIDLGSNDGIKKDMAVITTTGLIGLISDVYEYNSIVSLITNLDDEQNSKAISVKLKENNDTTGVIEDFINLTQNSGSGEQYFVMKKIGEKDKIEIGNIVITSGLGDVFPEGIRVGTVDSISDAATLTKEAKINLDFNPSRISYVFIVENITD
ncbi:rod shape-determining protein MreC [Paenibacillus sp. NPDC056579]|uniref:rod shape-determining protein MreC n=1 Tax=Paenibacillus sp. NPDC056579 TaxID=3345871 RepID=UPI0036CDEFFD